MGKKKIRIPGLGGNGRLAKMTEEERVQMAELQYAWEQSVAEMNSRDQTLTSYRQLIRAKYGLPGQFTIDLNTGEIFKPEPATVA